MSFAGLPAAAFEFYAGLRADNSKVCWTAHRTVYEDSVRAPIAALLDEPAEEFGGTVSVFRQYRDVRFSRDNTTLLRAERPGATGRRSAAALAPLDKAEAMKQSASGGGE
jgi:uncharacterized protein (DUF2461 family)